MHPEPDRGSHEFQPPVRRKPVCQDLFPRSVCQLFPIIAALLLLPAVAAGDEPVAGDRSPDSGGMTDSQSGPVTLISADPVSSPFFRGPLPRTAEIAADATLNDVCAVGSQLWAVGQRGVICTSSDAGQTWVTQLLPFECSLHSVSFMTERRGYIAGSRPDPLSGKLTAVLLLTRDGGRHWEHVSESATGQPTGGQQLSEISAADLPGLRFVRFFDLRQGVVVTSDRDAERAVLQTADGGQTWTRLTGSVAPTDWMHAAFSSQGDGLVVGSQLAFAAVVGNQLVSLGHSAQTQRRVRAALLNSAGHGWIAGDGGFLLHSQNGGISWQPPAVSLPQGLTDLLDFHTVAQQGRTVCVAGRPGSVILRSDDQGTSWSLSRTGQSVPLRRIAFAGPDTAVAVGDLGLILRSDDAGTSWVAVRNGGFRAAVMSLITDPADTALAMLASISGDQGFRSVVLQPSVDSHEPDQPAATDELLTAAVTQVGGNVTETDWMFPRTAPQHHTVRSQLLETWNRQTDGRLSDLLPLRVAAAIRIWRPDVITIERRSAQDRVADLWIEVLTVAQRIAEGTDARGASLDAVGLEPWLASRILVRTDPQERSALSYAADDLLPRVGTTAGLLTDIGQRWLHRDEPLPELSQSVSYRAHDPGQVVSTPVEMFLRLNQQPGSDSRRALPWDAGGDRRALETVMQSYRTQQAALTGHLTHLKSEFSLTAEVRRVGSGLPAGLALSQLQHLIQLHTQHENLEGLIAVLQEVTRRFPDSPDAVQAARSLFTIYSSAELRLLRSADGQQTSANNSAGITGIPGLTVQPKILPASATIFGNSQGSDKTAVNARWDDQAARALAVIRNQDPAAGRTPDLLLREAANLQRQRLTGQHNAALSEAAQQSGPFAIYARAELQAVHGAAQAPIPVINLSQSARKPFLDGSLDEECWQQAREIRLQADANSSSQPTPDCLLMMAWDPDFLYLAGRIQRIPSVESHSAVAAGQRGHDADHGNRDRLEFAIDTDRDYSTAFCFSVDEAGQTRERCWLSGRWNPEWFVATDNDSDTWRFEIAIPVAELSREPLSAGTLWAVQLRHIVPGYLQQSLQPEAAADEQSTPAVDTRGYGLLRFIR